MNNKNNKNVMKFIKTYENYPIDSNNEYAPWNKSNSDTVHILEIDDDGLKMIERTYITRHKDDVDWDDYITYIDFDILSEFIKLKLNLDLDDESKNKIKINIKDSNKNFIIETQFGVFLTTWDELIYLSENI